MKMQALLTQNLLLKKVTRLIDARQGTFGRLLNESLMATELHQTINPIWNLAVVEANKMIGEKEQNVKQFRFWRMRCRGFS